MDKRLDNDTNIKNLKKREIIRYIMIVLLIVTIVLVILYFVIGLNIIYPLITYTVSSILKTVRLNIPINKSEDLIDVKNEINKVKKHKK